MNIVKEYGKYVTAKDRLFNLNMYKHKYIDEGAEWYYMSYYTALNDYNNAKELLNNNFFRNKLSKLEKILMRA